MSGIQQMMFGGSTAQTYVDDVFVSYLRSGTGASASITTGFQPDLVWTKARSAATGHYLTDSARGVTKSLNTNGTAAQATDTNGITAFGTTGYTVGSDTNYNNSTGPVTYVDWALKKAPKFFDVVTYTGDGTNNRAISHNLGTTPGMVIVKNCTDTSTNWKVRAKKASGEAILCLNSTEADSGTSSITGGYIDAMSSTTFTVTEYSGSVAQVNQNGKTFVAYLFAHDTTAEGLIQCGSFTTDGSGNATVNHGWMNGVQFATLKASSTTGDWETYDTARTSAWSGNDARLRANLSNAEDSVARISASGTSLTFAGLSVSQTYIYMFVAAPA